MVKFGFGSRVAAFTAAALMATTSASAMANAPDPKGDGAAAVTENASAPASPDKTVRYCVQRAVTGTMLPKKTCKTREEWLKQGVDPTAPAQ